MTKTARHLLLDPPPPANLEARLEAVPDTQLPAADRRDRGGRWWAVAIVVAGLVLALGVGYLTTRGTQALDLATQVTQACADGQLRPDDRLCTKAAEVQTAPIPLPIPQDGRGVVGTTIRDGRLVVSYSDGTSDDVGVVAGPGGPAGRGIAGTTLEAGRLVVTFTDGTRTDLGPIMGPAGRGIASLDGSTGRLLVTLTDGSVVDAGPLPQGPKGDDGKQGDKGEPAPVITRQVFTLDDGRVRTCDRTGGTESTAEYRCGPATTPEEGGGDGSG